MAVIGKLLEVLQGLCGTASPKESLVATGAAGAGALISVSPAELVDAMLQRTYRRMPKSGTKDSPAESCPYTGLNRSALYELFNLRDKDGKPVIKAVSMRQEGETHGARYYSVGSVLKYLDTLAEDQASECSNKEDHGEHP